jgi:hypothetical protein
MAPVQFTYSLMTRSMRVSHASVGKRDPHLARGVERLLAAELGVPSEPPPAPSTLPLQLGDRRARSRIAVRAGAAGPAAGGGAQQLIAAAADGAGLVVTAGMPLVDGRADEMMTVVDQLHRLGALSIARLELAGAQLDRLAGAVRTVAAAGFDVLLLDPGDGAASTADSVVGSTSLEALPAAVAAAREAWRSGGWIAAVVHDRPTARAAVMAYAAQLVRAGADLLWVSAPDDGPRTQGARLPAAPLADRLRNELGVATAIECGDALLPDLEAAIAAGRADLIVVNRLPDGVRRAS